MLSSQKTGYEHLGQGQGAAAVKRSSICAAGQRLPLLLDAIPVVIRTPRPSSSSTTTTGYRRRWSAASSMKLGAFASSASILSCFATSARTTTRNMPVASFESDRDRFLGYGGWAAPEALQQAELANYEAHRGQNIEPCFTTSERSNRVRCARSSPSLGSRASRRPCPISTLTATSVSLTMSSLASARSGTATWTKCRSRRLTRDERHAQRA